MEHEFEDKKDAPDVDGLDEPANLELGEDYPLDSVFVRNSQMSVSDVMKRIKDGRWIMDPDFQRDFVWEPARQSRLIESCIMRIPLPVFYLAEAKDGKIIVVDGLQRLSTFFRYTNNDFKLTGLGKGQGESKKNNPLLGQKYNDLSVQLRERIDDTQLTLYILERNAPPRAKLDIFDRVNSGVPLSRQQMRNSLYSGKATIWLREVANGDIFRNATGGSLNKKSMRDREAINRFCGFYLLFEKYKGDMDTFLADTLEHMNQMNDEALASLKEKFENSMKNNFLLFGQHAFRKSLLSDEQGKDRAVINIALFDVCSVLFADVSQESAEENKDNILEKFDDLIIDDDFSKSITLATNDVRNVQHRFDKVRSVVNELELREPDQC
ncbi:DUF262 domain-containing protein [bacterium]|nr:DUF262 domain-containing protein [bacterium]